MHPLPAGSQTQRCYNTQFCLCGFPWKETQNGCLEVLLPMFSTGQQLREATCCGSSPGTRGHQPPEQLEAGPQRATTAAPWTHVGFPAWHRDGRDLGAATGENLCAGHTTGQGSRGWGGPASPGIIRGWIIWPVAGNWCPVPSFSCAGVRLPLP